MLAGLLCTGCQLPQADSRAEIKSVEGVLVTAEVSASGLLELLPATGGFLYFTSVEIVDVAIWGTMDDGLHHEYHAFLPSGSRHRISIREILPRMLSDEFQHPSHIEPTLTLILRGRHFAAPSWPPPKRRVPWPFTVEVRIPSEWLAEAANEGN